jgi:hypothetical protein
MSRRFPGMDPYLEGSLWTSVHTQLSAVIAWQLAPKVRPKYLVLPTERFVLEDPESVSIVTVEIRDTAHRRLVTAIEVLSPTNKRGDGRDEYLAKRRHMLLSSAHLVEIDLLRRGQRVPMREPLPQARYFVFVSRVDRRPQTDVWPIGLNQPLPEVPIPLEAPDRDVSLDLGGALANVYDRLGLDLAIDYTHGPEIPFSDDEHELARPYLAAP